MTSNDPARPPERCCVPAVEQPARRPAWRAYSARWAAIAVTALLPLGCERSVTAPSGPTAQAVPPAVDISGIWQGQYQETACQSVSCPTCCSARAKSDPKPRAVRITITQTGASLSGLYEEPPLETQATFRGSLAGQVAGYDVSLNGFLYPVASFPTSTEPWTLKEFNAHSDDRGTALSGSFILATVDSNGRETLRLVNDIVALTRAQ